MCHSSLTWVCPRLALLVKTVPFAVFNDLQVIKPSAILYWLWHFIAWCYLLSLPRKRSFARINTLILRKYFEICWWRVLLSTISKVLAIILSEEDGKRGNMGQKALTIRSSSNRHVVYKSCNHLRKANWTQEHAFALSNAERSWSPLISYLTTFVFPRWMANLLHTTGTWESTESEQKVIRGDLSSFVVIRTWNVATLLLTA